MKLGLNSFAVKRILSEVRTSVRDLIGCTRIGKGVGVPIARLCRLILFPPQSRFKFMVSHLALNFAGKTRSIDLVLSCTQSDISPTKNLI